MALSVEDQRLWNELIAERQTRKQPKEQKPRTAPQHRQRQQRPATQPRKTGMVKGEAIDSLGILAQRVLGISLLVATFVGTLSAVNPGGMAILVEVYQTGGFAAVQASINQWALVFAVGVQAMLTITEWYQRHNRRSDAYRVALLIDVALTAWGWGPFVAPYVSGFLQSIHPLAALATWPLIIYVAFEAARQPERIIVD